MLKTLGAQVKQYRWVTFITPVFSALEAVADMFLPMLMSQIIDKGVKVGGQAGMQAVLHYGAIMVAVAIGALVCGILAGRFLLPDAAVAHCGTVIRWGLYLLLFLVGLDMGRQGSLIRDIRAAGLRVLLVPLAVMAGTFAVTARVGLFLPLGPKDCVAAG